MTQICATLSPGQMVVRKLRKKEKTSNLPSNHIPFVCGLSMSSVRTRTVLKCASVDLVLERSAGLTGVVRIRSTK